MNEIDESYQAPSMRWLKIFGYVVACCFVLFVAAVYLWLRSMDISDELEEHERLCRANAKLIIVNRELWQKYKAEAEQTYKERLKNIRTNRYGKTDFSRSVFENAPSFHWKYTNTDGSDPNIELNTIKQMDIRIYSGKILVARAVGFHGYYKGFDFNPYFDCVSRFPNLYKREYYK